MPHNPLGDVTFRFAVVSPDEEAKIKLFFPALIAATLTTGCAGWDNHPPREIRNVQWRAVEIGGRPVVATPRPASMILADGASGSGGCNSWFAQYRLEGRTISFGQIGSTRIGCEGAIADQERVYFDILQSVHRYSLRPDGSLTLATPQEQTITFRRASQGD